MQGLNRADLEMLKLLPFKTLTNQLTPAPEFLRQRLDRHDELS